MSDKRAASEQRIAELDETEFKGSLQGPNPHLQISTVKRDAEKTHLL